MGASENFWADMRIFEGEKDAETLTQKMATGEYVIIGCPIDKLTEEPNNTPLTDQLQVGESISFYKDGELVKTSTILAKRFSWEQKQKRPQALPLRHTSPVMLLLYICRTLYSRKSMTLPRF